MADERVSELSRIASKWQKLLRLDDWKIAIGIGSKEQMQNQLSSINYVRETGQAFITILDKNEGGPYPFPIQEEEILVRKLLDLRFEMVPCYGDDKYYFKRALQVVAELLTTLSKKNGALEARNLELEFKISAMENAMKAQNITKETPPPEKKGPRVINV